MKNTIFRKNNNSGIKQKISIIMIEGSVNYEPAVLIKIRVLINELNSIDYLKTGYIEIKRYKDFMLVENQMSIQVKTLGLINSIVFSEILEELKSNQYRAC